MTRDDRVEDPAAIWWKAVAVLVFCGALLVLGLYVSQISWIYTVFDFVVDRIHKDLELNLYLARAVAAVVWLPFYIFLSKTIGLFGGRRRRVGLAGLSAYMAVYSLATWYVHDREMFPTQSNMPPVRYYILTQSGYRFSEEGGRDPITGLDWRPVTREVVVDWQRRRAGSGLKSYRSLDEVPELFNPGDGSNLLWYSGGPEGSIVWYPAPGFDPRTGAHLEPYTQEVHARYVQATAQRQRDSAHTQRTEQETAYRQRYVNAALLSPIRSLENGVIVAIAEEGAEGGAFEGQLTASLRKKGVPACSGVLTGEAFAPRTYAALAGGDRSELTRLGLQGLSATLLIGRIRSSAPAPSSVQGLLTVNATLSLTEVPLSGGATSSTEVTGAGAGVDDQSARRTARERLLEALLEDPLIGGLQR